MDERLILVTNDDGYRARGLQAMLGVARSFGRVVVVAPEEPQSGRSSAITMREPLFLREEHHEAGLDIYTLTGTPVDCIKMAFDCLLLGQKVDLVLSGINHGSNSSANILYSGTMGAAIEGSFYGCPSVGLSLDDHRDEADFSASIYYGKKIIERVLTHPVEEHLCLNVNIPIVQIDAIKGICVCRQSGGCWREEFVREERDGKPAYSFIGTFSNTEPEANDTDEWALAHGYVAVMPVQEDFTAYKQLTAVAQMLK